ncbi:hypothetical protein LIER_34863 [Lithospermum erythrorhizon]|uniref:Uncharacterized protein n=1 Tax=Lithospermum erythrorhizon TaxID=34254 RepID=A0AAV3S3C1_LITER
MVNWTEEWYKIKEVNNNARGIKRKKIYMNGLDFEEPLLKKIQIKDTRILIILDQNFISDQVDFAISSNSNAIEAHIGISVLMGLGWTLLREAWLLRISFGFDASGQSEGIWVGFSSNIKTNPIFQSKYLLLFEISTELPIP